MNLGKPDSSSLWKQIVKEVELSWPTDRWRDVGVVIGCSGGADSVALVRALSSLQQSLRQAGTSPRGFLIVAHFNHQLRGEESDQDQTSVLHLAQELGLQIEIQQASKRKAGLAGPPTSDLAEQVNRAELDTDEASLRHARMQFLIQVAKQNGARYIALAHSMEDNVETVLHHLMRGTGPSGLAGIGHPLPIESDLVVTRPLLHTRRELIRHALSEQNYAWREDQSNLDCRYRRNWIRHQLIPMMESEYPSSVEAIGRAIELQSSWRHCIDRMASKWLDRHVKANPDFCILKDSETDRPILIAAMQKLWADHHWPRQSMNQKHWETLAEMIQGRRTSPCTLPSGIRVIESQLNIRIDLSSCDRPSKRQDG